MYYIWINQPINGQLFSGLLYMDGPAGKCIAISKLSRCSILAFCGVFSHLLLVFFSRKVSSHVYVCQIYFAFSHKFSIGFWKCSDSLCMCVNFNLILLVIVSSILRITAFDYPFSDFKHTFLIAGYMFRFRVLDYRADQ